MQSIEKLDRFQIEAIYAFEMGGRNTETAASIMHISRGAMYNDLVLVKDRTGLNPYKPEQFKELYEAIDKTRKEKMHGADFNVGEYLCGK